MREDVIRKIRENKLLVVVRGLEKEKILPLAEAMYLGGIRLLEVTFDAAGAIPEEVTAACIRLLSRQFGEKMCIGAGTVLTAQQAETAKEAGAAFVLSPNANREVIEKTRALGLVSIPGALTPTEIENAYRWGADFVKVFPASAMGPGYIKAVGTPLSHIPLLAVGGITSENARDYLNAGAAGFGVSADIVDKDALAKGDYAAITARARRFLDAIK